MTWRQTNESEAREAVLGSNEKISRRGGLERVFVRPMITRCLFSGLRIHEAHADDDIASMAPLDCSGEGERERERGRGFM